MFSAVSLDAARRCRSAVVKHGTALPPDAEKEARGPAWGPRFAPLTPSLTTISARPHASPPYGEMVIQAASGMASLAAAQSKSNP
jgi:hypothetical protein